MDIERLYDSLIEKGEFKICFPCNIVLKRSYEIENRKQAVLCFKLVRFCCLQYAVMNIILSAALIVIFFEGQAKALKVRISTD